MRRLTSGLAALGVVAAGLVTVGSTAPDADAASGRVTKILVFVEENHSLNQMKRSMPYTFGLAKRYGYATNYRGVAHPSLPNYLAIASGSTWGIRDDRPPSAHRLRGTTVFARARAAGLQARVYAESMTSRCRTSSAGLYAVRHNPWTYFTGSSERNGCRSADRPAGGLAADITNGALPNAGMVVPNLCNDAHNCSLARADSDFRSWMRRIFAGRDWRSGHLAVVLTADEDDHSQGNRVLTVVIHPSQSGRVVTAPLTHYSLSRLYAQVTHTAPLMSAASAPSMAAAFHLPL